MNTKHLFSNNRVTKAMLGVTKEEFDSLLPTFASALKSFVRDRIPERKRAVGAGQKDHPNTQMPKKVSKNHPLTEKDKQNNRIISGLRIVAEHAIGGMKRYKTAADIYRNRIINTDDKLVLVSAGLWNFHLEQAT